MTMNKFIAFIDFIDFNSFRYTVPSAKYIDRVVQLLTPANSGTFPSCKTEMPHIQNNC